MISIVSVQQCNNWRMCVNCPPAVCLMMVVSNVFFLLLSPLFSMLNVCCVFEEFVELPLSRYNAHF